MAVEEVGSSENKDSEQNVVKRGYLRFREVESKLKRFVYDHKFHLLYASSVIIVIINVVLLTIGLPWVAIPNETLMNIFLLVLAVYLLLPVMMLHSDFITGSLEQLEESASNSIDVTPHSYSQSESQEEGRSLLFEAIDDNDVDMIKMIEYSSATVRQVVEKALSDGIHVKLLLKNPKTMDLDEDDWMEEYNRIRNSLRHYCDNITSSGDLYVRFYEENATLRGRKVGDDVINVGWYTFDGRTGGVTSVWGPQNPTIFFYEGDHENYPSMNNFFEEVFGHLWENGTTLRTFCLQEQSNSQELGDEFLSLFQREESPTRLSHCMDSTDRRQDWVEGVSSDYEQEAAR
jgi:hypothetical protein